MRVLLVAEPIGAVGQVGDGVEVTTNNLAAGLSALGHEVVLVAPRGSRVSGARLVEVDGAFQPSCLGKPWDVPITMPFDGVLAAMWEEVRRRAGEHDVVLNLGYDWLPLYLGAFLPVPVGHLLSLSAWSGAMDLAVTRAVRARPRSVAVHSRAQAATYTRAGELVVLGGGIDVRGHRFSEDHDGALAWVGRVSPEKGLGDAMQAAERAGRRLMVMGKMQEPAYWDACRAAAPRAEVEYLGHLDADSLQVQLGRAAGLLVTPHAVEAFGNNMVEALALGVPVVAYRRGGPAEIIDDGVTGLLVEPEAGPSGLAQAAARLSEISRHACRHAAESRYSREAFAERVAVWLEEL